MDKATMDRILMGGALAAPLLSGIASAGASAREARQAQADRETAARQAQMQWVQSLLNQQTGRATTLADQMPLGAEQGFVQRQAILGNLVGQTGAQAMPSLYGGVLNPLRGVSTVPYGTEATAQSLAERRKALAGIEPNFQFGSMSAYGLGGPGVQTAEQQVAQYARDVASQRMAQESAMTNLLNAQYAQASGQTPTGAAAAPKKGGFWSGLGKALLKVAPIAVSAIPAVGPLASAGLRTALAAAAGAGSAAASGGGLTGAILGGVTGGLGAAGAAPQGGTFLSNLQRSILTPQGLARVTAAAAPGVVGQAAGLAAPFLPGYQAPPTPQSPVALPPSLMPAAVGNGELAMTPAEIEAYNRGKYLQDLDAANQMAPINLAPLPSRPGMPAAVRQAVATPKARAANTRKLSAPTQPIDWSQYDLLGRGQQPAPTRQAITYPSGVMMYPATNVPVQPATYSPTVTQPNEAGLLANLRQLSPENRLTAIHNQLNVSRTLRLTPAVRNLIKETQAQLQGGR